VGGAGAGPPERAVAFQQRAAAFYRQLSQRRFNALETFNDPVLRAHFESEDLFFDYYADLAQAMSEAHFEKSRPSSAEVQEFLFESEDRVMVQVLLVGEDDRPLRAGRSALLRRDRWQWSNGTWWITPGKL
jgi:hypothetical protein